MDRSTALNLVQMFDALLYSPDEAREMYVEALENAGIDPERARVSDYRDAGMMTLDDGIVIEDNYYRVTMTLQRRPI